MSQERKSNPPEEGASKAPEKGKWKIDFLSVLSRLKELKKDPGNRDYRALVEDLNAVIQDWDGDSAREIRSAYPGWGLDGFKKLLDELGEDFYEEPRERAARLSPKNDRESWVEINELGAKLERLEYDLRALSDEPTDFEEQLETFIKNRNERQSKLDSMGWLQKNFTKKDEVSLLQRGLAGYNQKIEELKKKIKEKPKNVRVAEKRERKQALQKQTEEAERRLKELKA